MEVKALGHFIKRVGEKDEDSGTFQHGEEEKRERKSWRKAPLFLPGGRGNSELGCHVDNCLHLHLSSPW